jgi:hypothetical protein
MRGGTSTVTCSVTDTAGNTGTNSFTVTVNYTPPGAPTSASGTFTITDGPDGGDCTSIGTRNSGSKTCNVTVDITGNIIIGSDDITGNVNSNITCLASGIPRSYAGTVTTIRSICNGKCSRS